MRKDVLISSVRKAIMKQTSGTQDSLKFSHPAVVEGEVSKAYDEILKKYYASNINLMNAELDYYAKKYRLSISTDSDGVNYITLPVRPIQLRNNLGVRYVKPAKGKITFVRSNDVEIESINNLEVSKCLNHAFYYMDGNKRVTLEFSRSEHSMIEQVDVKVLPVFEDFDDSDDIEFPVGGKQATDMVLETMGFRPTDNTNDDVM